MPNAKYYEGRYALCARCSARPCCCPPEDATPAAPLALVPRPASGNAIPFVIWDRIIPAYNLTITESGVLLYCCRKTLGYGLHEGAPLSIADVGAGVRVSDRQAARALARLESLGLIVRFRRREDGKNEHARTWIKVCLP